MRWLILLIWTPPVSWQDGATGLWLVASTQVSPHWPGVGRSLPADCSLSGCRRKELGVGRVGQSWVGKFKCRQHSDRSVQVSLSISQSHLRKIGNFLLKTWYFQLCLLEARELCVNIAVRYHPTPTLYQTADASAQNKHGKSHNAYWKISSLTFSLSLALCLPSLVNTVNTRQDCYSPTERVKFWLKTPVFS